MEKRNANEIMREVVNGNEEMLAELMPICRNVAGKIRRQFSYWADYDFEDAFQESFTKVWTSRTTFSDANQFEGWFAKIFYNTVFHRNRHETAGKRNAIKEAMFSKDEEGHEMNIIDKYVAVDGAEKEYSKDVAKKELMEYMKGCLSVDQYNYVVACKIDGKSVSETAKLYNVEPSAISRVLNRAIGKLKKMSETEDVLQELYKEFV